MKRIFVFAMLAPLVLIILWYLVYFLPYVDDLHNFKDQSKIELSSAGAQVVVLAQVAYSPEQLRAHAIENFYDDFHLRNEHDPLSRLAIALWVSASHIHLNNKEIVFIWSIYAPYENGRGLSRASIHYYQQPISDLDTEQLAAIVAIPKSPSRYAIGSEPLDDRVKEILKKL